MHAGGQGREGWPSLRPAQCRQVLSGWTEGTRKAGESFEAVLLERHSKHQATAEDPFLPLIRGSLMEAHLRLPLRGVGTRVLLGLIAAWLAWEGPADT